MLHSIRPKKIRIGSSRKLTHTQQSANVLNHQISPFHWSMSLPRLAKALFSITSAVLQQELQQEKKKKKSWSNKAQERLREVRSSVEGFDGWEMEMREEQKDLGSCEFPFRLSVFIRVWCGDWGVKQSCTALFLTATTHISLIWLTESRYKSLQKCLETHLIRLQAKRLSVFN